MRHTTGRRSGVSAPLRTSYHFTFDEIVAVIGVLED
jgi:hypothetical protein